MRSAFEYIRDLWQKKKLAKGFGDKRQCWLGEGRG
jgi:hypothetical protein